MILPNKIIATNKSLLVLGAKVLKLLDNPTTVSRLWEISKVRLNLNSFQYFVLTLDFLYSISAIEYKNNRIIKSPPAAPPPLRPPPPFS